MAKLVKLNLILSRESVIGNGTENSPTRRPLKAFTEDGTLVFEHDYFTKKTSMTHNLLNVLEDLAQNL